MKRGAFDPRDFGVEMDREDFIDEMVNCFNDFVKGELSIDELLLHPEMALQFCNETKARTLWFSLPNDIILRAIMIRRKNPVA